MGQELVRRIDQRQLMTDLRHHALDHEVAAQLDATDGASTEEHHGESAGVIGEGELEAGDLLGPGLHPHGLHPTRDPDLRAPLRLADGRDTGEGTSAELVERRGLVGDPLGVSDL